MKEIGLKNPKITLRKLGIGGVKRAYWNLSSTELVEHTISKGEGTLSDTGAIMVNTGEFTGRSPKDKFTVDDALTHDSVDWNHINQPFAADKFDALYDKMCAQIGRASCRERV